MDNILGEINLERAVQGIPPALPQFERNGVTITISQHAYSQLVRLAEQLTEPVAKYKHSPVNELLETIGLYQLEIVRPDLSMYRSIQEDGFQDAIEQRQPSPSSDYESRESYQAYMRGYFEGRHALRKE